MADIFVSYARSDRELVRPIVALLEAQGWTVWWDTRVIGGERWDAVIEREIAAARCVVVVWTPASRLSHWVREEATSGLRRNILVPICIGVESPPIGFTLIQARDLSAWNGSSNASAVVEILSDVRLRLEGSSARAALRLSLSAIPASPVVASGGDGLARRQGRGKGGLRRLGRSAALALAAVLAFALAWYGIVALFYRENVRGPVAHAPPKDVSAGDKPTQKTSPGMAGLCLDTVTFACLRGGFVRGYFASDLQKTVCAEERMYLAAELAWRSIWTTSVYSHAPGGGGPGGGREDDDLRVGGWADWYFTLMQFETPKLPRPVRFAAVLMFSKATKDNPISMYLDRITQTWGWKLGDRLWWRDRPTSTAFVAALPQPEFGGWYAIEITDILEDWRGGRSVNNGLQLRPMGNDNYFNTFHSTRSPDLGRQPRLLVCT